MARRGFWIDVKLTGSTVRVVPHGELDVGTAPEVWIELQAGFLLGLSVTLDLRQLTLCDSTGIDLALRAARAAEQRGVAFVVVRGSARVMRPFALCAVDALLPMADSATGLDAQPSNPVEPTIAAP